MSATNTVTTAKTSSLVIPLKAGSTSLSTVSLRSLYNRAAKAFLHRDVALTSSLLNSAFAILNPPTSTSYDVLSTHRRKWDILRITLETTIYSTPNHQSLPEGLRSNNILSPQSLVATLYARSLELFTPSHLPQKSNVTFLPSQVVQTLVLASLKLDCPDVGRGIIEDWLARRGQYEEVEVDAEGYEKVLEMYCLHVLPRLNQCEYAKEFLSYEGELAPEARDRLRIAVDVKYEETQRSPPLLPSAPIPRHASPSLSSSSSTSSMSSNSTHTAVPRTPRASSSRPNGLSALSSLTQTQARLSAASLTDDTPTPRPRSSSPKPIPRAPIARMESSAAPSTAPSIVSNFALIRAILAPYLHHITVTRVLLFIVFPVASFLVRRRHRRLKASGATRGGATVSLADQARKRLEAGSVWKEAYRVISDTIRMGGSGLV